MTATVALSLDEAVLLIHAQLSHIAREHGIRVLFIKGPGAVAQNLRPNKRSSDADIWVEQDRVANLITLMQEKGWIERPSDPFATPFQSHAITLYHASWPCDIDVHLCIPGMEADPRTCFEAYWQDRTVVEMASVPVSIPSRNGSIIVLALNSLRSLDCPRSVEEYQNLLERTIDNPEVLLQLARTTNSLAALRPYLQTKMTETSKFDWPKPSQKWLFLSNGQSDAQRRLSLLLQTPLSKKPAAIVRALFPAKNTLLIRNIHQDTSTAGLAKAQMKRYKRGMAVIMSLSRINQPGGDSAISSPWEINPALPPGERNDQIAAGHPDDAYVHGGSSTPRPKTAVVIVTYNSADDISACLKSIADDRIDKIIVVDNNSRPDQALMVSVVCAQYPNVSFHQRSTNDGFGAGVNYGVSQLQTTFSSSDYIWILNPDAEAEHGAVEALALAVETSPYDILSPLITTGEFENGSSVWFAGGDLDTKSLRVSHTSINKNTSTVSEIRECTFITGAAMFMKLGTWNRL